MTVTSLSGPGPGVRLPWRAPLALLLVLSPALAAHPAQDGKRPRAALPTISSPAPIIDGDLSDAAWRQAVIIDELTEVDPTEGIPADPPTNIYLARDDKALYIAFECFEPNPQVIWSSATTAPPQPPKHPRPVIIRVRATRLCRCFMLCLV